MTFRIDKIDVPNKDPFQNDQLERKPVVEFLTELIGRLDGPDVMALYSTFGMGKSTLVRILIECLKKEGHRCIYFDACKVEYATDPLVALVASIDRFTLNLSDLNQKSTYPKHIQKVKELTTALVRTSTVNAINALTSGVIDLEVDLLTAKLSKSMEDANGDVVAKFDQESELFEKFRNELTEAMRLLPNDDTAQQSKNITEPSLIIFVDELDRSRPTFAVQLLERIKYLFDVPGIVFVLALDKKQIKASIKTVYGARINAAESLRRFFNLEYRIPGFYSDRYISSLITQFGLDPRFKERSNPRTQYDRNRFVHFLSFLAVDNELSFRDIEICIKRMRIVMDQTPSNRYLDPVLLAFLIVLHSNYSELYNRIINGYETTEAVNHFLHEPQFPERVGDSVESGPFEREIDIVHACLLMADPDRSRASERIKELKLKKKGFVNFRIQRNQASSILQMIDNTAIFNRSHLSLTQISKIIRSVSRVS